MAKEFKQTDDRLQITFDTSELTPSQVRLVRSINVMLKNVLISDQENEFFEGSAELMRLCAALIKQSRFTDDIMRASNIPYAEQALEYSVDALQDVISNARVVHYDN